MIDGILRAVVERYPLDCRPTGPVEVLGNAGGRSGARIWRFESGRRALGLRLWPVEGPSLGALAQIHGWLTELRDLGFVPQPLTDREGRTLAEHGGRLWQVEPWMPGEAETASPPHHERVRAGFAALGAVHERLAKLGDRGLSPGLSARLAEVDWLRRHGFNAIESALARRLAGRECVLARRWLVLARPLAARVSDLLRRHAGLSVPRQPCLRDVRPDHLLFTGDRLTGLVDPGAMALESPASDLARLLGDWLGGDGMLRTEALEAYGRSLDAATLDLIRVFERSALLLIGGRWARWGFLEGRFDHDRETLGDGLMGGVERVERLAGMVTR